MDYSLFLFTKLYDVIVGLNYEYDLMFGDLQVLYKDYSESAFNDPNKGEYDCMVDYLKANRIELLNK